MDNTGPYISYGDLLASMQVNSSPEVVAVDTVLSNKVTDSGGDTFEFVGGTPEAGQVLFKGGVGQEIIEVLTAPDRVRVVNTPSKLTVGSAKFLSSENVGKERGEEIIYEAMDLIDEMTGQFFNKRRVVVKMEGMNSEVLWLPVPIIEIEELLINSTDIELFEGEDKDFVAFKGRERPQDDRRNPKIKLNIGKSRSSIYSGNMTTRLFANKTLTKITGSFGFLEPDGSTPSLIKKATKYIAMKEVNVPFASGASNSATGPLKRLKVDLHEQEFFENKAQTHIGSITGSLGSADIDKIINRYKSPIKISGSIQYLSDAYESNGEYS